MNRRDFVKNAATFGIAAGMAPAWLSRVSFAQHDNESKDRYALVDPDLLPVAEQLPAKVIDAETLAAERASARATVTLAPPPAPQPVEKHIPGAKGSPEVRVLIFDPSPGKKGRGAYLHIHGGGFVGGKPDQFAMLTQRVAQECDCVVVSVDYRLAPETHFPGALEDNYAALGWLHRHAEEMGVDRSRIAIGGESAGGGHAAMLAIAARDRKEYPICFQLLIYPMLDDRTGSTVKVPPQIGNFVWLPQSNVFGWTSLLGVPAGSAKVPYGSVPARVDDFSGLPPAYVAVGAIDLFVEEDVEYARRLIHTGVPTELLVVPGAFHGFNLIAPQAPISVRFDRQWLSALKRALQKS